jgi:hypothetical protein
LQAVGRHGVEARIEADIALELEVAVLVGAGGGGDVVGRVALDAHVVVQSAVEVDDEAAGRFQAGRG